MQAQNFYSRVFDTAKSLGATDVQAHLAASQASQETAYGTRVVGNNYFGIKAPSTAENAVSAATHEYINGQRVNTNANFREFGSLEDAVAGYMRTMAQNFPAAWNAPSLSEAIDGLSEGTLGKYATDPKYENKVARIANSYGEEAQANSVSGDPLQAALTQPVSNGILTNGVTAMMSPFAAPEAVTSQSMPAVAADPAFTPSGWLAGTPETFAGLNTPETTGWNDMAAAGPVSAPMDVTATGQVKGTTQTPGYASVGLLGITPTADNMAGLGTPASASVGAVPSTQSFDVSRFGDPAAQMASASGSVSANPGLSAMASVPMSAGMFSPAMASQPVTSGFSEMAAAGPIGTTGTMGVNSPQAQAVQAQAANNLAAMNAASVAQNVTPTGLLGASPDLAATASVPSSGLLSSYAASQPVPAGIQAINAIAPQSSSLLSGQPLDTAPTTLGGISQPVTPGLLSMAPVDEGQYQSFTPTQTVQKPDINIATDPAVSMPSLQTVSVPDQPTIAGPIGNYEQEEATSTSTPQINTTAAFPSAPKPVGILGQMGVNKPMLAGGLLGAATLGPIGGLIGGLLGNQIAQQGGLKNVFGGGFGSFTNSPMSINNIGGGLTNVQSVYGGAPAGTQANTSNGGTVTATGGGWSVYTSPDGVSSSVGPNGLHASYFGPSLGGPSTGGGGFDPSTASPGLF